MDVLPPHSKGREGQPVPCNQRENPATVKRLCVICWRSKIFAYRLALKYQSFGFVFGVGCMRHFDITWAHQPPDLLNFEKTTTCCTETTCKSCFAFEVMKLSCQDFFFFFPPSGSKLSLWHSGPWLPFETPPRPHRLPLQHACLVSSVTLAHALHGLW